MSNECFNLREWDSNVKKSISKCEGDTNVLGLIWNLDRDTLRSTVNNAILEKLTEMTRRTILSAIQGIFDPLGIFYNPKCGWEVKLAWDSPLLLGLCNKFDKWFKEILLLQNVEIPRYCAMNSDSDLHVFVDASKNAYAACIFVRTKLASGIKLHLLRAKSRVAPIKSVSMPRLELLACCVGSRLANSLRNSLDIPDLKITYWSDSMGLYCCFFLFSLDRTGPPCCVLFSLDGRNSTFAPLLGRFAYKLEIYSGQENNEKYRQKGEPDLEQTYKTKRCKRTAQSVPYKDIRRDGINHWPIWSEKQIRCKFPNCKGYTQLSAKSVE
ncbi:uncharacterized protein TNIN_318801 [Trichonephila inaurata madagascariensis]|uniref:Uncharacterized protein n=1 Tax=Trichonephila inaurata madagascariensis TaxID=2747483 RepID=A0A8X7C839_9ARAC|nr:uncharacterized protein TNIN_318801 [Trichonephila inaurata madagascariensis]